MQNFAQNLGLAALKIGAIRLQPQDPFTWTTGYRMPIYNDNRRLLSTYENRALVAQGFAQLIKTKNLPYQVIAGTATSGICPATTLADLLQTRFCYVRSEAKGYGMQNKVEGIVNAGEEVILVEDLISTGKSSLASIQGLREAGAKVGHCVAIFSYGFKKADEAFAAEQCQFHVLLSYEQLLAEALAANYINAKEQELLSSWHQDPFGWGEAHGFPKVEKK